MAGQWHYLVIFLDLFSRKVVGWDLSDSLKASGTVRALQRALQSRRPAAGLLVHSDRGMQYSCQAFQELLRRHALVPSMSRKGDCWDNAVAESFFSHLKARVIEGLSFRDEQELRRGCLNTLRFTMPGSVSIRAMVGKHHNSVLLQISPFRAIPL